MQTNIIDKLNKHIKYILLASLIITILLLQNNTIVKIFSVNIINVDVKTFISLMFVYFIASIASLCIYLAYSGSYDKKYVLVLISILILVATLSFIFVLLIFMPFISWSIWGFAP